MPWRRVTSRSGTSPAPTTLGHRSHSRPGYRCPVLGLFGGADEGIPVEALDRFRETLNEGGVPKEIVVYDGAPHSFFDRSFEEHREACDDAWRRALSFVRSSG